MKLFLALLLPTAVAAGCCWTLISSNYDVSMNKWVCVYRSTSGTVVREFQNNMCSIIPQEH